MSPFDLCCISAAVIHFTFKCYKLISCFVNQQLTNLLLFVSSGVFGSETNETQSVSVMEGDSVTLHTDVTQIHEDEIIWNFGGPSNIRTGSE